MKSGIGKIGFKQFIENTKAKDIFPEEYFTDTTMLIDLLEDDFFSADTLYNFGEACFKAGLFYLRGEKDAK